MNEYIRSIVTAEEAVSLGVIEPLHGALQTFRHVRPLFLADFPEKARFPGTARNVQALCCSPGELSRLGVTWRGSASRPPGGDKMVTGRLSQRAETPWFGRKASAFPSVETGLPRPRRRGKPRVYRAACGICANHRMPAIVFASRMRPCSAIRFASDKLKNLTAIFSSASGSALPALRPRAR